MQLANKGWKKACLGNAELKLGLNVIEGEIVYKSVADAFGLDYTDVNHFL
jgi:alanine dehydrogenase